MRTGFEDTETFSKACTKEVLDFDITPIVSILLSILPTIIPILENHPYIFL